MTTAREQEILGRLARIPPSCRVYYRPLAPLLREVDASREDLAELVGKTAGEYVFSFDRGDHVRFERIARTSTPVGVPSTASTPAAASAPAFQPAPAAAFDVIEVGKAARCYVDEELKAGRTVSASDAVRHVLKQQSPARVPQGARGNPFAAENAANEARVAAQLAEVFERCYGGKRS